MPEIILMEPLLPETEAELDEVYVVHRGPAIPEGSAGRIEAVVTGGGLGMPSEWFDRLPRLRLVAINGVGLDRVDLARAKAAGVHVSTTPDVLTDDVADLALALLIGVMRRMPEGHAMVRDGSWGTGARLPLGRSLSGRTLGIVGLGGIGRAIGARAAACGMEIAYHNRSDVTAPTGWTRYANLEALAVASDAIAVAVAATPETEGLIDAAILGGLGPDGVLVNVARGSVVDEDALIAALRDGRIAGAGLDVFRGEPNVRADWADVPNVVLMPHQGSATLDTRLEMGRIILDNLAAAVAGHRPPTSVIDLP